MLTLVAVALGGAMGAVSRMLLSGWVNERFPQLIPLGTLGVNLLGAFLIGLLYVIIDDALPASSAYKSFLVVGLLGSLTTFSTFSIETVQLVQAGELGSAMLYVVASVILCLALTIGGIYCGRFLVSMAT